MKRLEWNSDFETGINAIDLQHHFFLSLINRLADDLHETDDSRYRKQLLNELIKYAQFHFASEENIMYRLGCPNLADHKKMHDNLIDSLHGQIGMFEIELAHAEDIVKYLGEWFVVHTLGEDGKLKQFVKENR
jgi:hemerythrin